MRIAWSIAVAALLAFASTAGAAESTSVSSEAERAAAAAAADASLLERVHRHWGFPEEEVLQLRTRVWFTRGKSEFQTNYLPATFETRGQGKTNMEFDDTEITTQYLDLEMRVPHVRWLRVFASTNIFKLDEAYGKYTETDWDAEMDDPTRQSISQDPDNSPWSVATGSCRLTDMDDWELSLGITLIGKDALLGHWGPRNTVMFYGGYRHYTEDFTYRQGTQNMADWAPTVHAPMYSFEDDYKFKYCLQQYGIRADFGFDDFCKGLGLKTDFAYYTGKFTGHGTLNNSTNQYCDRGDGEGCSLKVGVSLKRGHFDMEFGHEWLWLRSCDGSTSSNATTNVEDVDTSRHGLYLSIGWWF